MEIERFRTAMGGDVLHSWAADAQKEIDRLRAELAERGLALRQCIRDYNEVVADNDKLRAELAECRAAINDFLVGVSVYNDRLKPGRCAEPIEGPVIDALRAAAHKGEGEKE